MNNSHLLTIISHLILPPFPNHSHHFPEMISASSPNFSSDCADEFWFFCSFFIFRIYSNLYIPEFHCKCKRFIIASNYFPRAVCENEILSIFYSLVSLTEFLIFPLPFYLIFSQQCPSRSISSLDFSNRQFFSLFSPLLQAMFLLPSFFSRKSIFVSVISYFKIWHDAQGQN